MDKINYVIIYSWNEYHERSEIEPHIGPDGEYALTLRKDIPLHPDDADSSRISNILLSAATSGDYAFGGSSLQEEV
jgi:hypothetical protein